MQVAEIILNHHKMVPLSKRGSNVIVVTSRQTFFIRLFHGTSVPGTLGR